MNPNHSFHRLGTHVAVLFLGLTAMVLASTDASAPAQSASPIVEKLKETYDVSKGIKLDFDLRIYWKVREKEEQKRGSLQLATNDRFRLQLGATTWASDGTTFWQYNENTNQLVIKKLLDLDLSKHPSQMIDHYLTGYTYTIGTSVDGMTVLEADIPVGDGTVSNQSLRIYVDKGKYRIEKIIQIDRYGNESVYTFRRTRIGADFKPDVFTMTIPEGADVLDTRE
jgi:outer membrane lipoprotein-sorting protein